MNIELQEIEMNTTWREKYISALEAKLDFLNLQIKINRITDITHTQNTLSDYDYYSYKIEALNLEHTIYYEKKVLRDWKSQVQKTTMVAEQSGLKESDRDFEKVLNTVKLNAPQSVRLQKLLSQLETTNISDPEQKEIMYSQFKRALQMLQIQID